MKPEVFDFFARLVQNESGIALTKDKVYLLENRLGELARTLGLANVEALYREAKSRMSPKLRDQIVDAMTTNETYFFRDQAPFDALRQHIIPELIEERKAKKVLRFWSAACSTGQEPYSIAMLLLEHFPQVVANWRIEILATDISSQALEKAQSGRYSQVEVNRGLPVTLLVKYFKQRGALWEIDEKVRRMVTFRKLNLKERFPPIGPFDVVLCRYVLIYFAPETKREILAKLEKVIAPKGYLFLGATETPMGLSKRFVKKTFGRATCYQLVN
ncbi:CheR family methyltransferase [Thermosulfuriphilus sp.]